MSFGIESSLLVLLKAEGGYSNNPNDAGGETNHGITRKVAQANGYAEAMKDLPLSKALDIYRQQYWFTPGFDKVAKVSPSIAGELFDTGVNMGPSVAIGFLIQVLNALNRQQKDYEDVGFIQQAPVALAAFLNKRGQDEGEHVFLKALNCLQGARYIRLAEDKPQNEDFLYGWLSNRVSLG